MSATRAKIDQAMWAVGSAINLAGNGGWQEAFPRMVEAALDQLGCHDYGTVYPVAGWEWEKAQSECIDAALSLRAARDMIKDSPELAQLAVRSAVTRLRRVRALALGACAP